MAGSFKSVLFVAVAVLSQITLAQQAVETSEKANAPLVTAVKSTSKGDSKGAAAKAPKLTPDQILANQTLESAESQSRGLEAPMRSYSLLQIAEAFAASDPPKARGLLQDAFSPHSAFRTILSPRRTCNRIYSERSFPSPCLTLKSGCRRPSHVPASKRLTASSRATSKRNSLTRLLTWSNWSLLWTNSPMLQPVAWWKPCRLR